MGTLLAVPKRGACSARARVCVCEAAQPGDCAPLFTAVLTTSVYTHRFQFYANIRRRGLLMNSLAHYPAAIVAELPHQSENSSNENNRAVAICVKLIDGHLQLSRVQLRAKRLRRGQHQCNSILYIIWCSARTTPARVVSVRGTVVGLSAQRRPLVLAHTSEEVVRSTAELDSLNSRTCLAVQNKTRFRLLATLVQWV